MGLRSFLNSKIFYAKVTQTELYYEGSITIDEDIINKANMLLHERVVVLNMNNGARLSTYIIKGKKGSGTICLNGPAARQAAVGDKIVVLSYTLLKPEEIDKHKVTYVELDENNAVKTTTLR